MTDENLGFASLLAQAMERNRRDLEERLAKAEAERDQARAEVARLQGSAPLVDADPRPLTPEAFVAACQRCRPTKHLHGWHARNLGAMVEALLRERDEARADYTAERERANEWLAQLHDSHRERDEARAHAYAAERDAREAEARAVALLAIARERDEDLDQ